MADKENEIHAIGSAEGLYHAVGQSVLENPENAKWLTPGENAKGEYIYGR